MSSSFLTPERPLLISPTLAATIGLEEAVMLHVISELSLRHPTFQRNNRRWVELSRASLAEALPFWQPQDITRIQQNLQEKGVLLVEAVSGKEDSKLYAINQHEESASPANTAETASAPAKTGIFEQRSSGKASHIPPDWQPGEELYAVLAQHNIPRDFISQRVREFVMYQRERQNTQYSWHNTFRSYILREWRKHQSYQGAKELEGEMNADWRPNDDAMTILEHAGINREFIEDAIPEFVLYWRERGLVTSTWNSKFIGHVRRQWAKFNAMTEDHMPRPVPADFEPSATCYEILAMANIDLDFARKLIPEFILYWQERGEAHASWNTKFLQWAKLKWANRAQAEMSMDQQLESTIERFTDRSWAD